MAASSQRRWSESEEADHLCPLYTDVMGELSRRLSSVSVSQQQQTPPRFQKCAKELVRRRLPILQWLPGYRPKYLQHDIVAGITVALTVIPQGMAYANLAGLPLQYGLYTSFVGVFVYAIFGSTSMVHIGPTSMMAILVLDHVKKGGEIAGPAYAILLSFLSGTLQLLLGLFRMGRLVDFISLPVSSGFSSAASVIVIVNLLKSMFGLRFKSSSFHELVYKLVAFIPETNFYDLTMGLSCMITLIILKRLNARIKRNGPETTPNKILKTGRYVLWFSLTARNALVVIIAGVAAYFLTKDGIANITLSDDMEPGLPMFHWPPFGVYTGNTTVTFFEMSKELGSAIALVPLVAILQHMAIAKSFAQGRPVDATQEVITLGLCNILGSLFSAFPVTASFSRTALNVSSGIRTPFAGVITGSLVLLALSVMAPSFRYLPKAALAAVIINAVITMVEYEMIPLLWHTKKSDLFVWLMTFFGCLLLGAEYGILVGIVFSLIILLYMTANPRIRVENQVTESIPYLVVEADRAIFFPGIEYARYKINCVMIDKTSCPVVIDGSHLCGADYTMAQGLKQLMQDCQKRGQVVIFYNLNEEVLKVMISVGLPYLQHCDSEDDIITAIQAGYQQMVNSKAKEKISSSTESSSFEASKTDVPNPSLLKPSTQSNELPPFATEITKNSESTALLSNDCVPPDNRNGSPNRVSVTIYPSNELTEVMYSKRTSTV